MSIRINVILILSALLFLGAAAFAGDASKPSTPILTDAQKYEARTLQLKFITAQVTIQEATANIERAKVAFKALSDSACGKEAVLIFAPKPDKSGDDEPVCEVKPPIK
jgi:hypothetical protein